MEKQRCAWVPKNDELYIHYHDTQWGVPVYGDRELFAKLLLDGAQAGLSWKTILYRTKTYYQAFDDFDAEKMAKYDEVKIQELLQDKGIIRNKLKVNAFIKNAQAYLEIQKNQPFSDYLWGFMDDGKPLVNSWTSKDQVPAVTPLAEIISKDLKKKGFLLSDRR